MATPIARLRRSAVVSDSVRERAPVEFQDIHDAADELEPRLSDTVVRTLSRYRGTVSVDALGTAIAIGNVAEAMRLFDEMDEALSSIGTAVRDAVHRGGRIGATRLREAD